MSGNRKEFGDYQTPIEFCEKVCNYLYEQGLTDKSEAIFEPTCGLGNFLSTAFKQFNLPVFGVDINSDYVDNAKNRVPSASIINQNIFEVDIRTFCPYNNVLLVGNPPWATNADLSYNLPQKANFKELKGIDALTGSSNFDICEYIILRMIEAFSGSDSTICMLCKTSVARNVVLEIDRRSIAYKKIEMLNFNSYKVFGVSAAACIFIVQLSSKQLHVTTACDVKDFDTLESLDNLKVINRNLHSANSIIHNFEGVCQMTWRSGVKHDCSKVMELELKDGSLYNKYKEKVDVEDDLIFPLVKSSLFKSPIITEYKKFVIVTQQKAKQNTDYIEEKYPHLWSYLNQHIDDFNKRKSIIYKKSGAFSMFGIGDYSFAPYKVGVSGFYKKPLFSLLVSDKPIMTDDTSYFISFDNYNDAYTMMLLLNTQAVQDYLTSIAFLDSKRPYTVKLLSRIDLNRCVDTITFQDLLMTEKKLQLQNYVTSEMYDMLVQYVQCL